MKSVTVIIPTFNRWPFICSAVDSVLAQTYTRTHCIIVDDASSDNTAERLREIYAQRIRIVVQKINRGPSACRNIGVEASRSDCICFLDSDDMLEPNAVASRVSLLNERPGEITASFGLLKPVRSTHHPLLREKNRGDELRLSQYLENKSWCHNNGFLIDRDVFLHTGMYNPRLRNKEDIELLIRLLHRHPFRYCGEEIGTVRNVCGEKRARNDYRQIIDQGMLFSSIIADSPVLMTQLSASDLRSFICSDVEEALRALYKSHKYKAFRSFYTKAARMGYIRDKKKFRRRYLAAYLQDIRHRYER
ncbi:glycosyltransferase family 2 protein [Desulfococcus multivorans]|jgi:glycosyltransferase involved in cell wall biosynthesis|uniref:Glycosyl transferase family 2 n=1 Tax=Desulfococcus multivorans DSM 2059 TaxID=1121405 RepID=S7TW73_DESML|nr:glycosyltransferase family 2 protein [Desulfococcus multivorans]AOY58136.1 putative glycosyl transferase, family 2 [Desulfococcus multivorans]AQV00490.1 hypothetical protein B2D07_06705 [Desulfococcus multivorans]EPR41297.1 glycosyl transferase family 2 [Desulfococcus multivorans DSM 2059]MDX9818288.1 glycosyltransferase family 2 protein [Desulfococcus multivorans]SJZ73639.1 Glycosyl transferase family 2 [Desulfococcus multivorans DSM 2059]